MTPTSDRILDLPASHAVFHHRAIAVIVGAVACSFGSLLQPQFTALCTRQKEEYAGGTDSK
jgi:hypothetical protein